MNNISLIGQLIVAPVYFCTEAGRDLTRFQLSCATSKDAPVIHHCQAWGPAALDLHQHLEAGERLQVRGELRYRERNSRRGGVVRIPVIHVREYSYLGRGC